MNVAFATQQQATKLQPGSTNYTQHQNTFYYIKLQTLTGESCCPSFLLATFGNVGLH